MKLTLLRLEQRPETVKRGIILVNGSPKWTTLELPWQDNAKSISCIPEGTYTCERVANRRLHNGKDIRATFEVCDVPNRDGILFHTGNRKQDTQGCILIGQGFSDFKGELWIVNSRLAFADFLEYTQKEEDFTLVIKQYSVSEV